MKRPEIEIVQRDGRFLAYLAREIHPMALSQAARDAGYRLAFLCARLGISERHLRRVFEEGLGIGPKEWLRQERMVAARKLLREGGSIKEVAADLGFSTPKMLARDFQAFHGVTPTEFQRQEFARMGGFHG